MLQKYDVSLGFYTEAYDIYFGLHARDPENPSHLVELVRSESKVSTWHIVQKTAEHDEEAMLWLDHAESHLNEVCGTPRAREQRPAIDQLRDEVQKNRAMLEQQNSHRKANSG